VIASAERYPRESYDNFVAKVGAIQALQRQLSDLAQGKTWQPYLDRTREKRAAPPPKLDYVALEASNASQGRAGEVLALEYERARLLQARREDLACRVEWCSQTSGDYLGFDIRSFEVNGKDRFVEVKTTKGGKEMPFCVTRNEVRVSREYGRAYYLYRLFRFQRGPRLYMLPGALERSCVLGPLSYEARVG
jgi:Protein NO VEIN, C-terminal